MALTGEREDQRLETPCLPILQGAHVRGPPRLRSRDLGGITDDEGGILVEQPKQRLLEGSPLQEAVDLRADEEGLEDGPSDFGDPRGAGLLEDPLDDHGRLFGLVFPVEEGGGKLVERFLIYDPHLHHPLQSSWLQGVSHLMSRAQGSGVDKEDRNG